MTYELAIGDRSYSSWSLRGWLLFAAFDLPVKTRTARMYSQGFHDLLADFAPARLVPAMKTPAGDIVYDTLAMAETLAEAHPDIAFWPKDPAARALARSITAEMHAGFGALRDACTMVLNCSFEGFEPSAVVLSELARIDALWTIAHDKFGNSGPWLFGEWSIVDVFYAPVATRIATFDLPVGNLAQSYVRAHLANPHFRRWRAMGAAENYQQPGYHPDLPTRLWPGPAPISASPVKAGTPENALCPYSQLPVTDFMAIESRVFGFCNPWCRDKTVADPMAWPEFVKIYQK
ncbi:MAG: glutathione S-transferase [Paracoccaceae bacterium]|jgi:glutathione S-transferase